MTPATDIRAALAHPNVIAFLRILRAGESNQSDSAYSLLYGGASFPAPPWRHPYDGRTTTEVGHSTAAGAYQFLGSTWRRFADLYPADLPDFSPASQDFASVADIAGRGALPDVLAGNLVAALSKLRDEWTSLKGLGLANATDIYQAYGGALAPDSATIPPSDASPSPQPPAEPAMPVFLLPLIQTLIGAFTPAATAQLTGILAKAGGDSNAAGAIVSNLLTLVAQATGTKTDTLTASPQEATKAISAVISDADKLKAVEEAAIEHLNAMAPTFDKLAAADAAFNAAAIAGRDAARARATGDTYDVAPVMVKNVNEISWVMVGGLMASIIAAIICKAFFPNLPDYVPMILPALTFWLGQISKERGAVFAYRFDSTPAANAINAINAETAARK
jgi:muramidase (phage lysozyme)